VPGGAAVLRAGALIEWQLERPTMVHPARSRQGNRSRPTDSAERTSTWHDLGSTRCVNAMARLLIGVLVLLAGSEAARAQPREITLELFGGGAWNLPMPLTIRAPDIEPIRISAHYATRPFKEPLYYAVRIGTARGSFGFGAELVHHKLYLTNPVPPIEHLEVSHGYNLVMLDAARVRGRWRMQLGVGVVVAHPEGRIARRSVGSRRTLLGGGYHIAGVTAQLGVGRRYPIGRGSLSAFAIPEVKLTASLARVPFAGGSIVIPNVAVHTLLGLGVRSVP
jgi:hypothetical protein